MRFSVSRYLDASSIVSRPVFAISLGWAFFANFLDTLNNPPGLVLERIAAITFVHLVLFGLLYVSAKLTTRLSASTRSLVVAIMVLPLTALRGLMLALIFTYIRGDDLDAIFYRSASSIMVIGLPILLAAVVLHQIRGYSRSRERLLSEKERVHKLSDETKQQIEELTNFRVNAVKDLVLASLPNLSNTTNQQTIEAIGNTVENVVRPLSHQLEKEAGIVVREIETKSNTRIDWAEALKSAFLGVNISPRLIAISFVVTASTRLIFFQTPLEALYLLTLAFIGPWILLRGLKRILIRITPAVAKPWLWLFFVLGVLAIGQLVGIATLPASTNSPEPLSLVFQAPFYLFGITVLLALANSTRAEAALANQRLEETTTELSWEVTRVLDEHRQLKRRLAKALHGPIQTQLMSSVIRLGKSGEAGDQTVEEIRTWLTKEFANIESALRSGESRNPSNLKEIFTELGETWEGLAIIELRGTPEDSHRLETDPRLMVTLGELVPELAFNSIKHGLATSVVFEIQIPDPKTLLLTCQDNGTRPPESSRVGLGTKLLDECAIRWSRFTKDGNTHTEIELPFLGS